MEHIYFNTIAIDFFRPVFRDFPETNFIVLETLRHFNEKENVNVWAFVIMPDHIHLLWEGGPDRIHRFKSFTAQRILDYLSMFDLEDLSQFRSHRSDRRYKFWKSTTGNLRIFSRSIFLQKLKYIHRNPTKAPYALVQNPIDYSFSSAYSYWKGQLNYPFLTISAKAYESL